MRLGFSSYSFQTALTDETASLFDVLRWIAEQGAEHLEIAVLNDGPSSPLPNLSWSPQQIQELRHQAGQYGVALSGMCVSSDLLAPDGSLDQSELDRLQDYVRLAADLGITRLRHDVTGSRAPEGDDSADFDDALPVLARGCQQITQYAAHLGVVTAVENHGYFVQASERVRRLVRAVGDPNFGTVLDVGNFVCVDEDPVIAVSANLPYAVAVHLKDFYVRAYDPGHGWFRSRGGRYLRGAILGQGDLDLQQIFDLVRQSDFDGDVAIEFEGLEPCFVACGAALQHARQQLGSKNKTNA